jgi:hypothetical protein
VTNSQRNTTNYVLVLSSVSVRRFCQWIDGRKRYAKMRFFYSPAQACKFFRSRQRIVTSNSKLATMTRLRLNPIRIRDSSAFADKIKTVFELFAASQS